MTETLTLELVINTIVSNVKKSSRLIQYHFVGSTETIPQQLKSVRAINIMIYLFNINRMINGK